ncbi:MAG: phage gp6-like head-tail connector protein [Afipia sp.]|nr:phage gp6-like head-tail connector protein [Afipia sp.]
MTAVSLEDAKAHLRLTFSSDDDYIDALIEAAEDYVQATGVGFDSPPQPAVIHAVKLLVSHWYQNRDAAGTDPSTPIQFGVNALLAPYREVSF